MRHLRGSVTDAQIDARQGQADCAGAAVAVIGVGGVHVGFGHAIALQNPVPGAGRPVAVGFGQQRGRAGNEQANIGGQGRVKPGIIQKAGVKCRHSHHRGGMWHLVKQCNGVELRQEYHGSTRQQGHIRSDKQPMRVENRQGMQQDIPVSKAPCIHQNLCIRQQVALGQHRPFGPTCGAAGIQDRGQISFDTGNRRKPVGLPLGQTGQRTGAVMIQRLNLRPMPGGDFGQSGGLGGGGQQQCGPGMADEIIHFGGGIGRIQRQKHQPGLHTGGINRQRGTGLFHLHRHPVTRGQAQTAQRMGEPGGQRQKRRMGQNRPIGPAQKRSVPLGMAAKKLVIKRVWHGLALTD